MDENTLTTIKRNNLGVNKIIDIFDECRKVGVPLNVELIVGLPGETLESWENTIYGVFEIGQHDSIEVWQAQILENAEMNLSQRNEYTITGQKVLDYFPNSLEDEAPEFSEIVTSTSSMNMDEMVEAYKLAWFVMTWHTGGFSQMVARFIKKYKNISYKEFYQNFREFLKTNEFWNNEENEMSDTILNWYRNGEPIKSMVGPVEVAAPTNQYRTIFKVHNGNQYELFYNLISEYLKIYDLPDEIQTDLLNLNKCVVSKFRDLNDYTIELNHNLLDYIIDMDTELETTNTIINVKYPHDPIRSKDLAWFMESIFFARRRSFGKNYLQTL
jgi:hypothetical protein